MIDLWIVASAIAAGLLLLLFCFGQSDKDLPPGPRGLPLLGYLPWLDAENAHVTFTELADKFGPIYSIRLGGTLAVILTDVGLIREALAMSELSGRAPLYLTHGIMNGNGIICAEGEKWRDQRKFVSSHLRQFGMVKFGEKREKMESDIKKGLLNFIVEIQEADEAVDTEPILMHVLGNVVFNLVFGKTWSKTDEIWKRLLAYQEEGTKLIGIAGPINFLPFLRFLPKYRKVLNYIKTGIMDTHGIYEKILEDYRKSAESENEEPTHFLAAFNREMKLRGNQPGNYSLTQFDYLMADLWGAGVDTTIATLRWFYLYMAVHETVQEQVQKEIDQVVGENNLSLSDIPYLPTLLACISETQRIRSVTPLGIPHGTLQSTYVAGYRIPRGTMVVPLQWAVHMNPSSYPEPETYDPSRFLGEDGKYRKMDAFLPFQTGKRTCPGEEYAKMMLFLFGGGVLQKFTLAADKKVSLEGNAGITLTPKPHKILFVPRKVVPR